MDPGRANLFLRIPDDAAGDSLVLSRSAILPAYCTSTAPKKFRTKLARLWNERNEAKPEIYSQKCKGKVMNKWAIEGEKEDSWRNETDGWQLGKMDEQMDK